MSRSSKIPVGILGATGMVGQRLVTLLENHPWLTVAYLAASERSAGMTYAEATASRWAMDTPLPEAIGSQTVLSVEHDMEKITDNVALVFSALDAERDFIRSIEESYAGHGIPVVSNNSAHRWTEDVPMLMPEVNPHHLEMLDIQKKKRGWSTGCIVTKPNCSIQSYVPILHAWRRFDPKQAIISTYQAISGAGKTFESWPEMRDNVIPYIDGEEEKSEKEPLKIWGSIERGAFRLADTPLISAQCIRVPVSNGHMASIFVRFGKSADIAMLIDAITHFKNPIAELDLPSAPSPFIMYCEADDRPQTAPDRDIGHGMGISVGRIRGDTVLGFKCVGLSHNTIRGAAGGSILNAELLLKKGYIQGI